MKQFDIYWCDFEPVLGSEQGGRRPCVVLQSNALNKTAKTFLVAPLSTKKLDQVYRTQVLLDPSDTNGLLEPSKVKLDQVRVVDLIRFKQQVGKLDLKYQKSLFSVLSLVFDFNRDFAWCL